MAFFLTYNTNAQNKYGLIINLVDKDTALAKRTSLIQSIGLQTSFNSMPDCSNYIYKLPEVLVSKGYTAASVDSMYFDSTAAYINLFLGPQYEWAEINTDSVEKKALDATGWNDKEFR